MWLPFCVNCNSVFGWNILLHWFLRYWHFNPLILQQAWYQKQVVIIEHLIVAVIFMSWHLGSEKSSRKGALVITATLRETFAQQNVNLMSHSVFLRNRTPPIIALKMHHCHITSSNCDWWGGTYKQTTTKLTEIQSSSTKNTDFHVSRCVSHYWCKLLSFLSFDKHHLQQVNVLLAKATPHCIMATKKKKRNRRGALFRSADAVRYLSHCFFSLRLTVNSDGRSFLFVFSRLLRWWATLWNEDGSKKKKKSPSCVSLWSAVARKTCSLR